LTNITLESLVERIYSEAGFEIFFHVCERPELNDFYINSPTKHGSHVNYIRAIYKLKKPIERIYSILDQSSGDMRFDVCSRTLQTSYLGNIYRISDGFDIVASGQLKPRKETEYTVKKRLSPGVAFWYKLFRLKTPEESRYEIKYSGDVPLSKLIETSNNEPAYFISMTLRADINDDNNRSGEPPKLNIICNRELATAINDFIFENPDRYMDFIRMVLPKEKFPNVRKGIVDKVMSPTKIYFVNTRTIETLIESDSYNPREYYYQQCNKREIKNK